MLIVYSLYPVCIGCPSGWECCATLWEACVCTVPGWDSCCIRVTDPICIAANAACWVLKKPLDLILQGTVVVVDKSRHSLDVVKAVVSVAQGVVYAAKGGLDGAIGFLKGVKATYKIGVNAISALADFTSTRIINIHEMYFKVGLSVAGKGAFHCQIKGILMGQNLDVNLHFDTKNIWSLVMDLAEKAIAGLSEFIG